MIGQQHEVLKRFFFFYLKASSPDAAKRNPGLFNLLAACTRC